MKQNILLLTITLFSLTPSAYSMDPDPTDQEARVQPICAENNLEKDSLEKDSLEVGGKRILTDIDISSLLSLLPNNISDKGSESLASANLLTLMSMQKDMRYNDNDKGSESLASANFLTQMTMQKDVRYNDINDTGSESLAQEHDQF